MRGIKITESKILKKRLEKGFTVVELMIATVIFSLVLMGAMVAMIQMSKLYYKGITNSKAQELNRNVMAEISQGIQFSRNDIVQNPPIDPGPAVANANPDDQSIGYFCIGSRRFTYIIDRRLSLNPDTNSNLSLRKKESRHVLWVDSPVAGCVAPPADHLTLPNPCADTSICTNGTELMSEGARITMFTLVSNATDPDLWNINLSIAYGEDDLLVEVDNRYVCEGAINFSEFCAISELSTTVLRRL